jgi:hypothetical protein
MPGDFFAAIGFRPAAFLGSGFLTPVRFGVAFLTVPLAGALLFGLGLVFALFRGLDFRGSALVAFGRLVVALDERRLAADFGEAR